MRRPQLSPSHSMRLSGLTIGALLLLLVPIAALLAPWLPLADPGTTAIDERLLPIFSSGHPFGTDHLGRDLLSRLVWGVRLSVLVGVSATLAAAVGTLFGLVAGLSGRIADTLLMRGIDILMAFPYLLLALGIIAVLGPGLFHAMVAIAIANVPFFAHSVRDVVLTLKRQDFVDAARLAGLGPGRILLRELLPNLLPVVSVLLATTLGWVILEIAGLSFLGLGARPPEADLGGMLGEGRALLPIYPQLALLPGLVLVLIVAGFHLLGDGMRVQMDPRQLGVPVVAAKHEPVGFESDDEPDEALLRVRDLQVAFPDDGDGDDVMAVAGVDLTLEAGERVALVGESGAGKTMMALSLMRLVPSPGRIRAGIRFAGQDIITLPEPSLDVLRGNYIAYIPHDPSATLDPLLTIGDQLREAILAHQNLPRREIKWQMHALLEQVRLPKYDAVVGLYPHQLSSRMLQRAAIAIALANGPELLIADEPTGALDLTIQEDILVLLDRLCREHDRALLFVSRELGVAARLCRRVLVMYAGRIVEDAPVLDLVRLPFHPYSRELIANVPELGRPDKVLTGIPDEMPDLANSGIGCAFAPRCRYLTDACMEREPDLKEFGNGRRARCIRVTEIC